MLYILSNVGYCRQSSINSKLKTLLSQQLILMLHALNEVPVEMVKTRVEGLPSQPSQNLASVYMTLPCLRQQRSSKLCKLKGCLDSARTCFDCLYPAEWAQNFIWREAGPTMWVTLPYQYISRWGTGKNQLFCSSVPETRVKKNITMPAIQGHPMGGICSSKYLFYRQILCWLGRCGRSNMEGKCCWEKDNGSCQSGCDFYNSCCAVSYPSETPKLASNVWT